MQGDSSRYLGSSSRTNQPRNGGLNVLPLPLFVFRVFTYHHDFAMALNDLAFFTDFFYRRPYFHRNPLLLVLYLNRYTIRPRDKS